MPPKRRGRQAFEVSPPPSGAALPCPTPGLSCVNRVYSVWLVVRSVESLIQGQRRAPLLTARGPNSRRLVKPSDMSLCDSKRSDQEWLRRRYPPWDRGGLVAANLGVRAVKAHFRPRARAKATRNHPPSRDAGRLPFWQTFNVRGRLSECSEWRRVRMGDHPMRIIPETREDARVPRSKQSKPIQRNL